MDSEVIRFSTSDHFIPKWSNDFTVTFSFEGKSEELVFKNGSHMKLAKLFEDFCKTKGIEVERISKEK